MKKHLFLIIAMLMIGVAVAKPPTKQEKQAQKQAEIAAVLDVIKQGRFAIYEPNYSELSPGEKLEIMRLDISDKDSYTVSDIKDKSNIYQLEFTYKSKTGKIYPYMMRFYKTTGGIIINDYQLGQTNQVTSMYIDVVKLVD